jgi:UDP-hydrolysing UDP-N-acetyl-D-glucosamine 2-epimerase
MSAKKIAVCVMSRANYGRLKSVIDAIIEHPQLELQLICGCSCLNLPYKIDTKIDCLMFNDSKGNMAKTEGLLTIEMVTTFERLQPDIVLVHGDRFEVLACAVAASYMGIPLAHTEGGEVTGCIDDKVRNAITALTDIHFPVTVDAAKRINKNNVHVVGSPALDTLTKLDLSNNREEDYILVLHHPNTTECESIEPLIEALSVLDIKKVWVNPNTDAGNKTILKKIHNLKDVEFVKDLQPEEYYRLLANCEYAIGNSSSFIKEGAFLGVAAVLVGNRQQGREHAHNIVFAENTKESIAKVLNYCNFKVNCSTMFGDGTSGKRIADILAEV